MQNAKKAPDVPLGETVKARLKQFSVMNKFKKKALRVRVEMLLGFQCYPVQRERWVLLGGAWGCVRVLRDHEWAPHGCELSPFG